MVKSGSAEQVQQEVEELMSIIHIIQDPKLSVNTIVRKYRSKLASRIGLRLLPGKANMKRMDSPFKRFCFVLSAAEIISVVRTIAGDKSFTITEDSEDFDVPSEVEETLEELFGALQDKVLCLLLGPLVSLIIIRIR